MVGRALELQLPLDRSRHFRVLLRMRIGVGRVSWLLWQCDAMEPGRRPRYFTPREVEAHARPRDLWVSFLGRVHDLTPLAREHEGDVLLRPILEAAGTDITHWFNPKTRDLQTCVDPLTGCPRYYTPQGRVLHVPPLLPRSDWANDFGVPWWKDVKYEVGILSAKTRLVRVINTLTSQEHVLEVCAEESLWEILRRYLPNNAHAGSYTWKHAGAVLDMERTLEQNGLADDDEELWHLGLDPSLHAPGLLLHFNDDLTEL